jgi:hypothetical protein
MWGINSFPELYSRVWCHVVHWKSTDVSGEHIVSIFRNEEAKHLCFLPTSHWILPWIILSPQKWRRYVPLKRRVSFNWLHGVISQKMVFCITTAVRNSDATYSFRRSEWKIYCNEQYGVDINLLISHVECVLRLHCRARPRVAGGGDCLRVWRVAPKILNKKPRTTDMSWSSSYELKAG